MLDSRLCAHQSKWYVVQTKLRQEFRALEHLQNQDYECYLPTLQVTKLRGGKPTPAIEPLFSRYLFIRLDSGSTNWGPIRSTRGVSNLVAFGGRFATLPDNYVSALQSMPQPPSKKLFATGDQVTIAAGPFAGLQGLYELPDGESRAFVLIELMRQPQKISFALDVLHKSH
jgi:transcriptional antiterminator RfaH